MVRPVRTAILVPVYDDTASLGRILSAVRDRATDDEPLTAYVVDDGSEVPVEPRDLPAPTSAFRVVLARHAVNLGQGAALETARRLALGDAGHDAYVTMDADGQHDVADALRLARAVHEGADAAFGNRFLGRSNVPFARRVVLFAARWIEWALTGLSLHDAHNGLRALSRRALEAICIRQNRMAHATEIKQRLAHAGQLVVVELPVSVRYTRESIAKGQRSLGAVDIVRDLLLQYLFGEP